MPERLESQKTRAIKLKKIKTVIETTFAANPRVGVKASGEVSRITPYTCQCCRIPDRTYPINPMSQAKVTVIKNNAY